MRACMRACMRARGCMHARAHAAHPCPGVAVVRAQGGATLETFCESLLPSRDLKSLRYYNKRCSRWIYNTRPVLRRGRRIAFPFGGTPPPARHLLACPSAMLWQGILAGHLWSCSRCLFWMLSVLGVFWSLLGRSWRVLSPLDRLLESLEALLEPPGALLAASWSLFGRSWGGLGASRAPLGPSWRRSKTTPK